MPLVVAIGVVGAILGVTAILVLKEVRVTAEEVPGVTAGIGFAGLGLLGLAAYFFFKR